MILNLCIDDGVSGDTIEWLQIMEPLSPQSVAHPTSRGLCFAGEGSFGVVSLGVDLETGRKFAIKRLHVETDNVFQMTQVIREVKLMKHLRGHQNVLLIEDVILTPSIRGRRDCFLVMELMQSDLHRVMDSQTLTLKHVSFFMYQILRGLKYLHSVDCIHRDLKPQNLLVNQNCDLRICDFGLARVEPRPQALSELPGKSLYVVSRWYRAPELLHEREYGVAVDNWAVGCIFAELLRGGRALFPGADRLDMLRRIGMAVCGSATALFRPQAPILLRQEPPGDSAVPACPLNPMKLSQLHEQRLAGFFARMRVVLPDAPPEATSLLEELLRVDPAERATAECRARPPPPPSY